MAYTVTANINKWVYNYLEENISATTIPTATDVDDIITLAEGAVDAALVSGQYSAPATGVADVAKIRLYLEQYVAAQVLRLYSAQTEFEEVDDIPTWERNFQAMLDEFKSGNGLVNQSPRSKRISVIQRRAYGYD